MKKEHKEKLIELSDKKTFRGLLIGIPFFLWLISMCTPYVSLIILSGILLIVSNIFLGVIEGWKIDTLIISSHKIDIDASTDKIIQSSAVSMYNEVQSLRAENEELRDILVSVTHHEGALDEYKSRWEPIVQDELTKRWQKLNQRNG